MNRRHRVAAGIALATVELGAATSCTPPPAPAHVAHHTRPDDQVLTVAGWVVDDDVPAVPTTATTGAPTTTTTEPEPAATAPVTAPVTTRRTTTTVYEPPSPQSRTTGRGDEPPGNDVWGALANCESGGNPATDTGNGYYGAFQFSLATWRSVGESGYPSEYSYAHQLAAAQRLQARSGWGQWPACSRRLGLA